MYKTNRYARTSYIFGTAKSNLRLAWSYTLRNFDLVSYLLLGAIFTLVLSVKFVLADVEILGIEATAWQNIFIGLAFICFGWRHGFRLFLNPILLVYSFLLINTFFLASKHHALSPNQMVQSYLAYGLGLASLHIVLPPFFRRFVWQVLPWMAVTSVLVGIMLDSRGFYELFKFLRWTTQTYRLQGASTPSTLAHMALLGMLIAWRLAPLNKFYIGVAFLNYGIIVFTASRIHIAMALMVTFAYLVPYWLIYHRTGKSQFLKHIAFIVLSLTIITATNYPTLIARFSSTSANTTSIAQYTNSGKLTQPEVNKNDKKTKAERNKKSAFTSGRTKAWKVYWQQAQRNLVFGRGLGAGSVANPKISSQLNVPHNEYLRIVVEGGFVGLGMLILAYAYIFWRIFKQQTRLRYRLNFLAGVVMFGGIALVDNILNNQAFSVVFWLWCAMSAYHTVNAVDRSSVRQWGSLKIVTRLIPQTEKTG